MESKALAAKAFDQVGEPMLITDASHRILDANRAFSSLIGMERDSLIGLLVTRFLDGRLVVDGHANTLAAKRTISEVICKSSDRKKLAMASVTWVPGTLEEPGHHLVVVSDLLTAARLSRKNGREVYFDALTGLPNLQLLTRLLEKSIQPASSDSRTNASLTVCSLDIDHFKQINDRYGHVCGDRLVVAVAQRISHHLRDDDILARVGGDEFVLLLHQRADDETLAELLSIIREPFLLKGCRLQITASLGATVYPRDDATGDVLLRHATQAMHRAKELGRNTWHIFDPSQDRAIQDRESERRRFASALADGELRLHYQPQVDLFDGQVVGLEALVRWQHPERGLLGPGAFLPTLEGTELKSS